MCTMIKALSYWSDGCEFKSQLGPWSKPISNCSTVCCIISKVLWIKAKWINVFVMMFIIKWYQIKLFHWLYIETATVLRKDCFSYLSVCRSITSTVAVVGAWARPRRNGQQVLGKTHMYNKQPSRQLWVQPREQCRANSTRPLPPTTIMTLCNVYLLGNS